MTASITNQYWTRQPITIGVAVLVHGVVMLMMPAGSFRAAAAPRPDSFVDIVTVEVPEEPAAVVPEPPRPVARVEREVVETPVAQPEEQPVAAAAPPSETPTPTESARPPVETMTAGTSTDTSPSGFSVAQGSANGSVTTTVASNGTTEGAAPAVVDVRALARDYRRRIASSIGSPPPLRGGVVVEGARVVVGFRISADGAVTSVRIVTSSGHPIVDEHVLEFARTIRRVPAPPPELRLDLQELRQPIGC